MTKITSTPVEIKLGWPDAGSGAGPKFAPMTDPELTPLTPPGSGPSFPSLVPKLNDRQDSVSEKRQALFNRVFDDLQEKLQARGNQEGSSGASAGNLSFQEQRAAEITLQFVVANVFALRADAE